MPWRGLLIFLPVLAGHFLLARAVMDALSRARIPRQLFLALLPFIAAATVALPALLLRDVGLRALWPGGHSMHAPLGWRIYISACLLTLAAGLLLRLYVQSTYPPAVQIACRSRRIDIARELGFLPAGPGPRGLAARLPLNEVFQIDVVERELRLPRLPRAWDGLSILHITDLHYNGTPDRPYFQRALELAAGMQADLVALTGDIIDRPELCDWLASTLGPLSAPLGQYFVLGNHDYEKDPERVRAALSDLGWTYIGQRFETRELHDQQLVIAGVDWPFVEEQPDFSAMPDGPFRLLLAHTPHIVNWARKHRADLMLSGHLHGGQIRLPLLGPIRGGWYNSGLFHYPPTVLHVSRALGELTPIRFGCPPEITKLILRAK